MDSITFVRPFDATAGTPLAGFYSAFEPRIGSAVNYSDLEYTRIDLSVGGTYNFSDRLYTTASLTYSDFSDDEEYVYGDESGSSYYGYAAVGYRF